MTDTKRRTTFVQQPLMPSAVRVACRDCHVAFEDSNGHRLCDRCLVEYINGAGILELDDDDLFPDRPTAATARLVGTVACVACSLRAGALLCKECMQDIPATRAKVRAWLDGVLAQMDAALDTWEALRTRYPAYWVKLEESREKDPPYTHVCKCADHVAKGTIYGQLLIAEEAMQCALEPLGIECARLEKALEVLDAV